MVKVSSKVVDRFKERLPKYRRILKDAYDRDVKESDTVDIVKEILSDVMGFDKFTEVTCEYAIKGDKCDLAVKLGEKVKYLIEVKAIGLELKDGHRGQARKYCLDEGIPWFVVTNGVSWEVYGVKFKQPVDAELICSFNFLDLRVQAIRDQTHLFLLCREGIAKGAIKEHYEHLQVLNRYVVAALLQSDPVLKVVRQGLRKLQPGLKVAKEDIRSLLDDVLKIEVMEHDQTKKAVSKIKKALRHAEQESAERAAGKPIGKMAAKLSVTVGRTAPQLASARDRSPGVAAARRTKPLSGKSATTPQ